MTASPPSNSSLPATQNVESICAELQKIAQAKWELMDIDARRKELIGELNDFQMQDRFINDTKKTIQELNDERDSHSVIIHQINQDKTDLEKIINGAREDQKNLETKLSRSYQQIYEMLEQINRLSKESGLAVDELLDPSTLLPQLGSALPNFAPNILTSSASLTPTSSSVPNTTAPMSNLSLGLPAFSSASAPHQAHQQLFQQQQQQFLNQLKMNSALMQFNMDPNTAALMSAIASSYPNVSSSVGGGLPGLLGGGAGSSNALYPNALVAAAAAASAQQRTKPQLSNISSEHQSPPMKQCQSCSQEIHRNAPVCPYCRRRVSSQHSRRSKKANKAGQQKL